MKPHDAIDNVEAWAVVIGDLLMLVPPELRAAVLARAVNNETSEHLIAQGHNFVFHGESAPRWRHLPAIMQLKSLVVQVFVRTIANEHSPQDAQRILYTKQRHGRGSGQLADYLPSRSKAVKR
jgi:hypothetical protein